MNKPIATKLARAIGYHSLELLMFPLAAADSIDWKQLLPQDTFLERMERLSQQMMESAGTEPKVAYLGEALT